MMYCRLAFCAGWALNLFVDGSCEKNIYFKGPPPPPLNNDGEIDDAEEGALQQKTELYDGRNDIMSLPLHRSIYLLSSPFRRVSIFIRYDTDAIQKVRQHDLRYGTSILRTTFWQKNQKSDGRQAAMRPTLCQ